MPLEWITGCYPVHFQIATMQTTAYRICVLKLSQFGIFIIKAKVVYFFYSKIVFYSAKKYGNGSSF